MGRAIFQNFGGLAKVVFLLSQLGPDALNSYFLVNTLGG